MSIKLTPTRRRILEGHLDDRPVFMYLRADGSPCFGYEDTRRVCLYTTQALRSLYDSKDIKMDKTHRVHIVIGGESKDAYRIQLSFDLVNAIS